MSVATPPLLSFPPELPVSQKREEIARAIRDHQVVVVAGATGSGKTTQLPKICLELGRTSIGHTQPRRIAARTIAERIAEELGTELGGLVGYQVRFTDRVSADTRIKLMTDGILLNEIHRDRELRRYDTIILDEAHERSLTIDFLLGYLRRLLPRRPDLKVIVTSATIDPESFARHFAAADGTPAPVVEVSGRTYPVEIRYRPLVADVVDDDEDGETASDDRDYLQGITDALDELAREEPGDVLVFLSGENEIRDAEDAIRGRIASGGGVWAATEVLPLYGRLSAAEQHRVFDRGRAPGVRRRVVLATNVAETSLTVPGIRYVVDAGTARISRYSARAKIQRLPIEPVSQASANQRAGRAGRTSPGIAIRLYSEEDFLRRPEYTDPEILRTNLAAVILQMISLGLGDIREFPFLQPPDARGVKDGLDLLRELGAIDAQQHVTRVGRQLTQLPIDTRLARMVVESREHDVTREVMAIVAGLSIQDPRERPLDRRAQADQAHARFADPTSDFLTLLNLWNHLEERERELSGNRFRRMCKEEYLNYLRIREWKDVYRQLVRLAKPLGLRVGERRPSVPADAVHRSILAGLLSQLGLWDAQKREYVGSRNQRFAIFPGSAVAKKRPAAVMAAELVETSRLFARSVAAIDPAWAEPLARDLVKRSYSEPHWEKRQGAAVAFERVTLYGVPIVPRRRIQWSRVDPAHARELFVRHALVEGEWPVDASARAKDPLYDFDRANRRLRGELEQLEERTRRRDILLDDEAVVAFYERRVPDDVVSVRTFETWWRRARRETPDLLTLREEDLLDPDARVDEAAFPGEWRQGDQVFRLRYRFDPGAPDDGVTVLVPLPLLARVSPAGFDWQVPGLREELVTALLRTLPKSIRRAVVPAAEWARRFLEGAPADVESIPITEYLADRIRRITHAIVSADDFDPSRLPVHVRMGFAAVDARGRELGRDVDLAALQERFARRVRDSVAAVAKRATHAIEREGIQSWDVGELPRVLDTRSGGNLVRAYPALVDAGDAVAIRLQATAADQAREHPRGVLRLLQLTVPSPLSYVRDHLSATEKLALATSPYPSVSALLDDCLRAVLAAGGDLGAIWTAEEFAAVRERLSAGLVDALYDTVATVTRILQAAREADRALRDATSMSVLPALADAREQLDGLVHTGFVAETGLAQLRHLPRYLRGIVVRMERLPTDIARDRVWMTEVQTATARFRDAGGRIPLPPDTPERLVRVRWMLEELRVSLFAQQLGTAETVSLQRITRALA